MTQWEYMVLGRAETEIMTGDGVRGSRSLHLQLEGKVPDTAVITAILDRLAADDWEPVSLAFPYVFRRHRAPGAVNWETLPQDVRTAVQETAGPPPGQLDLESDSRQELDAEAALLHRARQVLESRFRSGRYTATTDSLRHAASELSARSRHPSRQVAEIPDPPQSEWPVT